MMTLLVALFLVIALSAYVLFGGADFGGGVLEATLPNQRLRSKLQATLAPVWEANHVWLIAVVVILFVGFPIFYSAALTRLFVPVSLALLSILFRGAFFTLRKYDPSPTKGQLRFYTWLFRGSSMTAPLFFGMVVAGLLTQHPGGPTSLPTEASYFTVYISPWFNPFGLLAGLFTMTLFGYLAAIFFYGELETAEDRSIVWKRAQVLFLVAFGLGGSVLVAGALTDRVPLTAGLHPVQLICQLVAAGAIGVIYRARGTNAPWQMRLAAGAQVIAILVGWFHTQSPVLLKTAGGPLTLEMAAAPPITQKWLLIGLVVVLALVIPPLVWLYKVFSASQHDE